LTFIHHPIEAYKGNEPYIFVSYAHKDRAVVYQELERLSNLGCRVWYDDGITPSRDWTDEIAQAIDRCEFFVVYVSTNSVCSENVKNEIIYALTENKKFLAIHIEETSLPPGLKLSMNRMQAIMKYENSMEWYIQKFNASLPLSVFKIQPGKNQEPKSQVDGKKSTPDVTYKPLNEVSDIGSQPRWIARDGGVVLDDIANLEWIAGPDKDTTLEEAETWVENLDIDGGGWRMPTIEELNILFREKTGSRNITPLLETNGWYVWSCEIEKHLGPYYFYLGTGEELCDAHGSYQNDCRGFAVRFRKLNKNNAALSNSKRKIDVIKSEDRYVALEKDIVLDRLTNLEWVAGWDGDITWERAKAWVDNLDVDGGGWRMPTRAEVRTLYKEGLGERNMTPLLKTTGWWVWTGNVSEGGPEVGIFEFIQGHKGWSDPDNTINKRAFAVRLKKQIKQTVIIAETDP
jgi:hypothetical protein